jgi:hypothetical protein
LLELISNEDGDDERRRLLNWWMENWSHEIERERCRNGNPRLELCTEEWSWVVVLFQSWNRNRTHGFLNTKLQQQITNNKLLFWSQKWNNIFLLFLII